MTLACQSGDQWDCGRQVTIGLAGIVGFIVCAAAATRLFAAWRRTSFHAVNCFMVAMAGSQAFLSAVMFLFAGESPQIGIIVKWFREIQVLVTFVVYARMALQLTSKLALLRCALHPTAAAVVLYVSGAAIAALAETRLSCAHPSWLLLSCSGLVLAIAFAASSVFVLRALRQADTVRASFSDVMSGKQRAVAQRMHQILVLLAVNAVSSVFQVCLDAFLLHTSRYSGRCDPEQSTAGTEMTMIALRLVSYTLPVWATLYVFYWVPRLQFDSSLDVVLTDADGQAGRMHEEL